MKHAHKQPFTGGGMRKAHNVPGFVEGLGPGAENLVLLSDYEDPYDAGLDLPNLAPNSPIGSLTNNNNVGVETQNPIVGQQSGDYTAANTEYHSVDDPSLESTGDFYIALWVNLSDVSTAQVLISHVNLTSAGWHIRVNNSDADLFVYDGGSTGVQDSISSGVDTLIEVWYTLGDGTAHLRVNDGTEQSVSATRQSVDTTLYVGYRGDDGANPLDGLLDNMMYSVAPQGDLFWPDHSTWLYNGGAGRSSDEILQYDP